LWHQLKEGGIGGVSIEASAERKYHHMTGGVTAYQSESKHHISSIRKHEKQVLT